MIAGAGGFVSLFHLRQDLSFADHHAVQAGGDHEQMAHGFLAAEVKQVVPQALRVQAVELGHESRDIAVARLLAFFLGRHIHFDAIAGR